MVIDLTNQKFHKLTVIRRGPNSKKITRWYCDCDCGSKDVLVSRSSLINGTTKSCGCLKRETIRKLKMTHGIHNKNPSFYNHYNKMIGRCYKPKNASFFRYGGRGIKVCDRWLGEDGPKNFYDDMFLTWKKGLTLERKNNNGNYIPENCRWATHKEQALNRRNTIFLEYHGEKRTVEELAKMVGLNRKLILDRLNRGWSIEKTLTTPVNIKYISKKSNYE